MNRFARSISAVATLCSVTTLAACIVVAAGEQDFVDLIGGHGLDLWQKPTGDWIIAGDARPRADQPKQLTVVSGAGTIVNDISGKTRNLLTAQEFGDVEAHFEFLVPRGSNSGVKFQRFYEIQISDSHGVPAPKASDCGGIYPRAEMLPRYHHIDEGTPPRVNAARPAGEWQTLHVIFRAHVRPRRQETEECPFRAGRLERPVDPRECGSEDTDRPCLADEGSRTRADLAAGRPRTGSVPQHTRPPIIIFRSTHACCCCPCCWR